jgi:DivIVA domain-containing protein
MAQVLLLLIVALTVGAVVFGVMVLVSGGDPGLREVEPDGRGTPLPGSRPLMEQDVAKVTFDVGMRGYRMDQVDRALKRVAYDIGYKDELINVLSAEVDALRDGRVEDAEALRAARLAASGEGAVPSAGQAEDGDGATEAGATIDLGPVEPSSEAAAFDDEVPDGPFAPWPAKKEPAKEPAKESADSAKTDPAAKKAKDSQAGADDEADHPTDSAKENGAQQSQSGDDRVVTRG